MQEVVGSQRNSCVVLFVEAVVSNPVRDLGVVGLGGS